MAALTKLEGVLKLFLKDIPQGAATQVYLATAGEVMTGEYYMVSGAGVFGCEVWVCWCLIGGGCVPSLDVHPRPVI